MGVSIIYHKSDLDGIGSAAVALLKFPDAKLYPAEYQDEEYTKEDFVGETVVIVDFCPSIIRDIVEVAERVIWCDHHKTQKDKYPDLWDNLQGERDTTKSGILLTWEYFFDDPAPSIVNYISDYDIWEFKYGLNTKYIHEYASMLLFDPKQEEWKNLFTNPKLVNEYLIIGSVLYNAKERRVKQAFNQVIEKNVWGYKVGFVNTNNDISELGNYIASNNYDVGAIWRLSKNMDVIVSLRSVGEIDVSKIALQYNGGGHKHASSFAIRFNEFIEWFK